MKTLIRIAVAGALMAGYATAQAQSLPSSGSSDLWLFVSDQTSKTTFAEDTGVSLSSIMGGSYTANASLASKPANFSVAASGALTSYLNAASSAGHTLEWSVLGAQFDGTNGANDPGNRTPGTAIEVFDFASGASADNKVKGMIFSNGATLDNGWEGDLNGLKNAGYTAGGTTYTLNNQNYGVWGNGLGAVPGSTNLYGTGIDQSGVALNQQVSLYGVTGNSSAGKLQSYLLGSNLSLSNAGVLSVSSVPLPAAVWLFGSGLLGLIGVGRRKAAAAV
jgi:hypothetical protein